MNFASLFSITSTAAMIGWLVLILAPRRDWIMSLIRNGLIGGLAIVYSVLILLFFFRVEGGGFGSIGEVRALFMSDGGLVAGWVHYLAFDLFVGLWIAKEADRIGMGRLVQAVVLLATFMFGPMGLMIFLVSRGLRAGLFSTKGV